MNPGIEKLDIHGLTAHQAAVQINYMITKASKKGAYRLRLIHGFHNGTQLKSMIQKNYPGNNPKVRRIEAGSNPGETDLVLREY